MKNIHKKLALLILPFIFFGFNPQAVEAFGVCSIEGNYVGYCFGSGSSSEGTDNESDDSDSNNDNDASDEETSDNSESTASPVSSENTVPPANNQGAIDDLLNVTKSAERVAYNPGEAITYEISVTNTSDSAVQDIVVRDILPQGFTWEDGTSTIVRPIASLGAGETWNDSFVINT
ncbi:MAG: hypothetical protein WDZ39_00280, partial [Candidatus Spechtbacterales bacterium]